MLRHLFFSDPFQPDSYRLLAALPTVQRHRVIVDPSATGTVMLLASGCLQALTVEFVVAPSPGVGATLQTDSAQRNSFR